LVEVHTKSSRVIGRRTCEQSWDVGGRTYKPL